MICGSCLYLREAGPESTLCYEGGQIECWNCEIRRDTDAIIIVTIVNDIKGMHKTSYFLHIIKNLKINDLKQNSKIYLSLYTENGWILGVGSLIYIEVLENSSDHRINQYQLYIIPTTHSLRQTRQPRVRVMDSFLGLYLDLCLDLCLGSLLVGHGFNSLHMPGGIICPRQRKEWVCARSVLVRFVRNTHKKKEEKDQEHSIPRCNIDWKDLFLQLFHKY